MSASRLLHWGAAADSAGVRAADPARSSARTSDGECNGASSSVVAPMKVHCFQDLKSQPPHMAAAASPAYSSCLLLDLQYFSLLAPGLASSSRSLVDCSSAMRCCCCCCCVSSPWCVLTKQKELHHCAVGLTHPSRRRRLLQAQATVACEKGEGFPSI